MKGCPSLYLLTWRRDSSVFWVTAIFLEQGLLESTACWNLIEQTDDSSCISLPLGWREGQFWQRRWRRAWCEAAGPDKQSFAWPPVSVISQRESLISKKVVNLLASVCPCLLCQEGAKLIFWRNRGGLLLKCSLFSVWLFSCEDSSSVSVSLSLNPSPLFLSLSLTFTYRHTFSSRWGIFPPDYEIRTAAAKIKDRMNSGGFVGTGRLAYLYSIDSCSSHRHMGGQGLKF